MKKKSIWFIDNVGRGAKRWDLRDWIKTNSAQSWYFSLLLLRYCYKSFPSVISAHGNGGWRWNQSKSKSSIATDADGSQWENFWHFKNVIIFHFVSNAIFYLNVKKPLQKFLTGPTIKHQTLLKAAKGKNFIYFNAQEKISSMWIARRLYSLKSSFDFFTTSFKVFNHKHLREGKNAKRDCLM